ncbi:MAG: hypothetical protein LBS86_02885 [Treponema sp.]|jgi:hypothetical protein|nr:hypothetical protein [Treponema sp.]
MKYDTIDVDAAVNAMVAAVEHGEARPATRRESRAVRLAALNEIVHEMHNAVKNEEHIDDQPTHTELAPVRAYETGETGPVAQY